MYWRRGQRILSNINHSSVIEVMSERCNPECKCRRRHWWSMVMKVSYRCSICSLEIDVDVSWIAWLYHRGYVMNIRYAGVLKLNCHRCFCVWQRCGHGLGREFKYLLTCLNRIKLVDAHEKDCSRWSDRSFTWLIFDDDDIAWRQWVTAASEYVRDWACRYADRKRHRLFVVLSGWWTHNHEMSDRNGCCCWERWWRGYVRY